MCGKSKDETASGGLTCGFGLGIEPVRKLNGQIDDAILDHFGVLGAGIGDFAGSVESFQQPVELIGIETLAENGVLPRARQIVV
jgi:hypothetical protein